MKLVPSNSGMGVSVGRNMLNLTKVAYMIAVKHTNILFGVLYGWIIFGELK
jgi:hypothetical protein